MKLNKRIIRKLIVEELVIEKSRRKWEKNKKEINEIKERYIKQGHNKKTVNENISSLFSGLFGRAGGLGFAEFLGPESQSLFGGGEDGIGSGIRTVIEQNILESIIEKAGLDPHKGWGVLVKNALEQVIRRYSQDELQQLLSDNSCHGIAFDIAKETLIILEESSKERILKFALDSVAGEFGVAFQTSPWTKGLYITIRERFSEAFDDLLSEDEVANSLADMICQSINIDNILATSKEALASGADSAFGSIASTFDQLGDLDWNSNQEEGI